jgi:hypothetical protein
LCISGLYKVFYKRNYEKGTEVIGKLQLLWFGKEVMEDYTKKARRKKHLPTIPTVKQNMNKCQHTNIQLGSFHSKCILSYPEDGPLGWGFDARLTTLLCKTIKKVKLSL